MSKFIDKLNWSSKAISQSMGFKAVLPPSKKPKLQLVACLAQAKVEGVADYVAGADAGILTISKLSSGAKNFKIISQAVSDIPWGGWLRGFGKGEIKQMVEAGSDFIVFSAANTALSIPQDDEAGKILQVELSLSEGLLRPINELPVDAVLIASEQEDYFLTWHHLMLFQHFADLLTKPLLVSIPPNVTANELQMLWGAGVDGVVIEVGVEQTAGKLNKIRKIIDNLTLPSQHKPGNVDILLPHVSGVSDSLEDDEEE